MERIPSMATGGDGPKKPPTTPSTESTKPKKK